MIRGAAWCVAVLWMVSLHLAGCLELQTPLGTLRSDANLVVSVPAGQATALSQHHLQLVAAGAASQDVLFHVQRPLTPDEGRLLHADRPLAPVNSFTQADVDALKIVYLPPQQVQESSESVFTIALLVTMRQGGPTYNFELRFRVHSYSAMQLIFRQKSPHLQLKSGQTINVTHVFELDDIKNRLHDIRYVIIDIPRRGVLSLLFANGTVIKLGIGHEFKLQHLKNGTIQYSHNTSYHHRKDHFEVLATDGISEAINSVHLTIEKPVTIQFAVSAGDTVFTMEENGPPLQIPILRVGSDLSEESQVLCVTSPGDATPDQDYEHIEKVVTFQKGSKSSVCEVKPVDDSLYEGEENFFIQLERIPNGAAELGIVSKLHVKIVDVEDRPVVQFERSHVAVNVSQPSRMVTINVLRTGGMNMESVVSILSEEGTVQSLVDYESYSQRLLFAPYVTSLPVHVRLKQFYKTTTRSFSLTLKAEHPTVLGEISTVTVLLNNSSRNSRSAASRILPTRPVILSWGSNGTQFPDNNMEVQPGYPVTCVTPCDVQHPDYGQTINLLCSAAGISDPLTDIVVHWEVSTGTGHPYRTVSTAPIDMLSTRHAPRVLDPVFFTSGFKIRCTAIPLNEEWGKKVEGLPVRSATVKVGSKKLCPASNEAPSFLATFTSGNEKQNNSKVHIRVEVPHIDGTVPIISTGPIEAPHQLMRESQYINQNPCSNTYQGSAFLNDKENNRYRSNPYSTLQNVKTPELYTHLDLDTCLWTFDAWFNMNEIVNDCGGRIKSEVQVEGSDKNHVTVSLSLYLKRLSASGPPIGWSTVEHQTELEVSFHYRPLLWGSQLKLQQLLNATLQLKRVAADSDGRLLLDFTTTTHFHGWFVTSHRGAPHVRSTVYPPHGLLTNMSLHLIWSQATWNSPVQSWRATSDYSLQDYSGNYTASLVACVAAPGLQYTPNAASDCIPQVPPVRLSIPVNFQHSAKPAALSYGLETHFVISNNLDSLLGPPENLQDYKGPYFPEETVVGHILWLPTHQLHSAYQLTVHRVYVCSGNADTAPTSCLRGSPGLGHTILLLDRDDPEISDDSYNDNSFEARFASEMDDFGKLTHFPGADGFIFKVAPLYSMNVGNQWYLQALYSIGPRSATRYTRSVDNGLPENASTVKPFLLEPSINVPHAKEVLAPGTFIAAAGVILLTACCLGGALCQSRRQPTSDVVAPLNSSLQSPNTGKQQVLLRAIPVTVWNDLASNEGTEV
ncbi:extracellular matrix organizing protein FRAS1-like [Schistocerca serialis cubense]|uniref:extracellular matrix organizing protein FRAS1-like n=1 Tax=Schistocerca serialis cubense TaxID=2023355 RepID=UPI00214F1914|nr:extracellular matrix organizing protein FRAS1-like [Schistocerca serialis cubense]